MIAAFHSAAALTALAFLAAGCANFFRDIPGDSALTVEARVGRPARYGRTPMVPRSGNIRWAQRRARPS